MEPLTAFDIPRNDKVDLWVKLYSGRLKKHFQSSINRSPNHIKISKRIFGKKKIPTELVWIILVESGFKCSAVSSAEAVGCWQIMKETGREHGLNMTAWRDERYDFIRSTEAAAKYLKKLHSRFGTWEMALAAYNYGPTRLSKKIKKQNQKNYWLLSLPTETENYVPKIYAVIIISSDLQKYGFVNPMENKYGIIRLSGMYDLRRIARLIGADYKLFSELNPGYRIGYSPPEDRSILFIKNDWDISVLESYGIPTARYE